MEASPLTYSGNSMKCAFPPLPKETLVKTARLYVYRHDGAHQLAEWTIPMNGNLLKAGEVVVLELTDRRERPR